MSPKHSTSYVEKYKHEDSIQDLRTIIVIDTMLLVILAIVPGDIHFHIIFLAVQVVIMYAAIQLLDFKNRTVVLVYFVFYALSTIFESISWISGLDGIIHNANSSGKGAPFEFLFQSPPYLYPFIRLGTILLFLPIFKIFNSRIWKNMM